MIEKNRLTRAELLIMRYVEDCLVQLRALASSELEEFMNLPSHNLQRCELVPLLYHLFETGQLVAKRGNRGYFTPSLAELEQALEEPVLGEPAWEWNEATFYGLTSVAMERYRDLRNVWPDEI